MKYLKKWSPFALISIKVVDGYESICLRSGKVISELVLWSRVDICSTGLRLLDFSTDQTEA